jgi:putative transposase
MEKVAPSERFRSELDVVLAGVTGEDDPIETVGRLGARLILQQALEDEVTEFLGRARYERVEETVSHRNGYEPRTVKTTSGPIQLERPRVRNASKLGFESKVLGKGVTRTHALESLVISGFLRGLSTRDVEAVLEEVFEEPVASKSTVSRIYDDIRERYRQWCQRRLDSHDIVYLFLDAIYLKLHPDDTPAEGVLVCWGVSLEGRKILLGLTLGSRESYESWLEFGRDMIDRGLRAPAALVIADGAPGIWKGRPRVVARGSGAALHDPRVAQRDQQATRAPPSRGEGEMVEALRRGTLSGRGPPATTGAHRRLSGRLSLCDGSHRARPRPARHASAVPLQAPKADQDHEPPREDVRGGPPPHQGDRPLPRRDVRPIAHMGRLGALLTRLARREDEPQDHRRDRTPTPRATTPTTPTDHGRDRTDDPRITFTQERSYAQPISPGKRYATLIRHRTHVRDHALPRLRRRAREAT